MKIKLNEGSSVEIVNHSGNSIVKVNEDGTIEGDSDLLVNVPYYGDKIQSMTLEQFYLKKPLAMNN